MLINTGSNGKGETFQSTKETSQKQTVTQTETETSHVCCLHDYGHILYEWLSTNGHIFSELATLTFLYSYDRNDSTHLNKQATTNIIKSVDKNLSILSWVHTCFSPFMQFNHLFWPCRAQLLHHHSVTYNNCITTSTCISNDYNKDIITAIIVITVTYMTMMG